MWIISFVKKCRIDPIKTLLVMLLATCYAFPNIKGPPPTRQDVHGRWEDALLWARMKVFRASLFVADVEKTLCWRRVRIGRLNYVLRTSGRKKTSWKLSYGPKIGRPLNVTSECDVLWTILVELVVDGPWHSALENVEELVKCCFSS